MIYMAEYKGSGTVHIVDTPAFHSITLCHAKVIERQMIEVGALPTCGACVSVAISKIINRYRSEGEQDEFENAFRYILIEPGEFAKEAVDEANANFEASNLTAEQVNLAHWELNVLNNQLIGQLRESPDGREYLTQLCLERSLCPLHTRDYAICFDDEDPECDQIRIIHPLHDT
jgi:hypothetical protein